MCPLVRGGIPAYAHIGNNVEAKLRILAIRSQQDREQVQTAGVIHEELAKVCTCCELTVPVF
jgi:orotate phosphoribosyltransferase-like protein